MLSDEFDSYSEAALQMAETLIRSAGYEIQEMRTCFDDGDFRSPRGQADRLLGALGRLCNDSDRAMRHLLASSVVSGHLTLEQAAERAGVDPEEARTWGILPAYFASRDGTVDADADSQAPVDRHLRRPQVRRCEPVEPTE